MLVVLEVRLTSVPWYVHRTETPCPVLQSSVNNSHTETYVETTRDFLLTETHVSTLPFPVGKNPRLSHTLFLPETRAARGRDKKPRH